MSSVPPPTSPEPSQPGQPAPAPGGGALPPTGLSQQLASIQAQSAQASGMGVNPQGQQFAMAQQAGGSGGVALPQPQAQGSNSLQQLGNKLATQYGLNVGRGNLFDESGNPNMTPEQIAQASGGTETMGTAAAKMQYAVDAMARQEQRDAQQKSIDTLSAGIGLVQSRARGSAAALQSGLYSQMAAAYANQEYEVADFSFYIQREQQLIEQELQRKARKQAKRNAIGGVIMGGIGLIAAPFTGGATLGMAAQGLGQLGGTGWI